MESQNPKIEFHPNGRPIRPGENMRRPKRNDGPFLEDVFPHNTHGQLLRGILRTFLIKQEPRLGWARKSACDESVLLSYPCESVAAHQWGVGWLVLTISRTQEFLHEVPIFDRLRAYEMAQSHDVPELVTGDITPVDGITAEEKHRQEKEAMTSILCFYPPDVGEQLASIYQAYEERRCPESKFVKDCDRLDFMITAFLLERQGFSGFEEFYKNSSKDEFFTKIAKDLAVLLFETRNNLLDQDKLFNQP